jgi:acetaldehyde dehydrogenase
VLIHGARSVIFRAGKKAEGWLPPAPNRRIHQDDLARHRDPRRREKANAIIVLNPAEPPLIMRDIADTFSTGSSEYAIATSEQEMAVAVQRYVPGYRLKQQVQFDRLQGLKIPGLGEELRALKTSIFWTMNCAFKRIDKLDQGIGDREAITSFCMRSVNHVLEQKAVS